MSGYQPNSYSQFNNTFKKQQGKAIDYKSKFQLHKALNTDYKPNNDSNLLNKNAMNKAMYTSSIQMSQPSKFQGKLDMMGRFVDEKPEPKQENGFRPFAHDNKRVVKNQMASSSIFGQSDPSELDRFPQFNLHAAKNFQKNQTTNPSSNLKKTNLDQWNNLKKKDTETLKNDSQSLTKRLEMAKFKGLSKKTDEPLPFKKPEQFISSNMPSQHSYQKSTQSNSFKYDNNKYDSSKQFFSKKFQKKQSPQFNYNQQITSSTSTNNNNEHLFKKKQKHYMEEINHQTVNNKIDYSFPEFINKGKKQEINGNPTKFKRQDFIVGKKMGKGQFGQVMIVRHKKTGFLCGMKVMEKKLIKTMNYQNQIARELSIQFYLAHRNIIPLFGYFCDEENVYLLIEFCTDGQLLEKLRKARKMSQADTSPIIKQIIEGIDYIHKQLIIHRDIKPQNILFSFDTVKICDFGWAVYKGQGMRKTASGSPLYYSPEIVNGDQYDEKIDIWDIGMMTYQCLYGKIPFKIYSELDLKKIVTDEISFPDYVDVEEDTKDFIIKSLKKDPDQRITLKDMLRHPFITKYKEKRPEPAIMEEIIKVVRG